MSRSVEINKLYTITHTHGAAWLYRGVCKEERDMEKQSAERSLVHLEVAVALLMTIFMLICLLEYHRVVSPRPPAHISRSFQKRMQEERNNSDGL